VTGDRDLRDRVGLAVGDPELLLDQVQAGDQLGDRVLDLERVFISKKTNSCACSSTRNSTVPAPR
jgi:hypothetical protein